MMCMKTHYLYIVYQISPVCSKHMCRSNQTRDEHSETCQEQKP